MWSSIKKQKEDDYHFGGERCGKQVLCNSFIPTILAVYILLVRLRVISIGEQSMQFVESASLDFSWYVDKLLLPTVLAYYCECSADTWGSEIGIISSTPYLLLLPWKPVPAGTNGGISTLGMAAAIASGVSLAASYYAIQPVSPNVFLPLRINHSCLLPKLHWSLSDRRLLAHSSILSLDPCLKRVGGARRRRESSPCPSTHHPVVRWQRRKRERWRDTSRCNVGWCVEESYVGEARWIYWVPHSRRC